MTGHAKWVCPKCGKINSICTFGETGKIEHTCDCREIDITGSMPPLKIMVY